MNTHGLVDEDATDFCAACRFAIHQEHVSCEGHQHCLNECPKCGGELVDVAALREKAANVQSQPQIARHARRILDELEGRRASVSLPETTEREET